MHQQLSSLVTALKLMYIIIDSFYDQFQGRVTEAEKVLKKVAARNGVEISEHLLRPPPSMYSESQARLQADSEKYKTF